jgi:hypothetical protein
MSKQFNGENPMPQKTKVAKSTSWKTEPMPTTDISRIEVNISVTEEDMLIIRKGHIPEAMEDHWFMYCDDEYIRYYRSWSGMCAFEAHFHKQENQYVIDEICINQALVEFGVNGDKTGVALFLHLLIAEVGGDAMPAWQAYLDKWDETNQKYANQETEIIAPTSPKDVLPKVNTKVQESKTDRWTDWYHGTNNHICEGCIYTNGIVQFRGCGRLCIDSFKQRYTSGKCEYRKTDLFIPSEFEKERKKVALQKKQEEMNRQTKDDDDFEEHLMESKEEERLRKYKENKEKEEKAKQDGSYARELIKDFIHENLDGDISKLPSFDFGTLREDGKYGDCKGFPFSVNKCNIVKAIM